MLCGCGIAESYGASTADLYLTPAMAKVEPVSFDCGQRYKSGSRCGREPVTVGSREATEMVTDVSIFWGMGYSSRISKHVGPSHLIYMENITLAKRVSVGEECVMAYLAPVNTN